ncbi:hypothetical protein ACRTAL_003225 [Clostridium perfringens]|uniref:hypothetical protein n=1 Tax=Clostridium perfringens TaxID=1502 RepID=UPI001C86C062|nr:hypothetical protein [Clostridium perfringens]EJT6498260.1 hypothetical protein [Clostridium perfringens]MDM0811976.1 hypothetical protein [Clostridium perfringens]HBZ6546086.1 hypothetical protein [Clostridium perfringens]
MIVILGVLLVTYALVFFGTSLTLDYMETKYIILLNIMLDIIFTILVIGLFLMFKYV